MYIEQLKKNFEQNENIKEKLGGLLWNQYDCLYEPFNWQDSNNVADCHWVNGAWELYRASASAKTESNQPSNNIYQDGSFAVDLSEITDIEYFSGRYVGSNAYIGVKGVAKRRQIAITEEQTEKLIRAWKEFKSFADNS